MRVVYVPFIVPVLVELYLAYMGNVAVPLLAVEMVQEFGYIPYAVVLDVVCVMFDEDNLEFHFTVAIADAFLVLVSVELVRNTSPTVAVCLFATAELTDVSTIRTSYPLILVAAVLIFMFVADVTAVLYAPIAVVPNRSPIPPPLTLTLTGE